MDRKKLEAAGLALRRKMFGRSGADDALDNATPFRRRFEEIVTGQCFGDAWNQPPLDHRMRSMLTIAILAGQSRPDQLQNHVKGAIANGVTKEEIREILLHAMLYVGLPAASDSWRQATAALKEIGAY